MPDTHTHVSLLVYVTVRFCKVGNGGGGWRQRERHRVSVCPESYTEVTLSAPPPLFFPLKDLSLSCYSIERSPSLAL